MYLKNTTTWGKSQLQKDVDEGHEMIRNEFDELYKLLSRVFKSFLN